MLRLLSVGARSYRKVAVTSTRQDALIRRINKGKGAAVIIK